MTHSNNIPANIAAQITHAVDAIRHGGVIGYPTESMFGLGCDPYNQHAVERLLQLKQRPVAKGLILIAASWRQIKDLIKLPAPDMLTRIQASWPGHVTWVFSASPQAPAWICGQHPSIAIRITAHPIAQALCQQLGSAIVSTSANLSGQTPAYNLQQLQTQFPQQLDAYVDGNPSAQHQRPSAMYDANSGAQLRG